jgi:hypothetical protein
MPATISTELLIRAMFLGPPFVGGGGMLVWTMFVLVKRSSRPRSPAPRRISRLALYLQMALLMLGFGVYITSLFIPATNMPVPDTGKVVPGLAALVWGFPFWGMNLWFLVCPLLMLWINSLRDFGVQLIAFVVQFGCALAASCVAFSPDQRSGNGFYPGGILWSVAFWLLLAAYVVPTSLISETEKQSPQEPAEPTRVWTEW